MQPWQQAQQAHQRAHQQAQRAHQRAHQQQVQWAHDAARRHQHTNPGSTRSSRSGFSAGGCVGTLFILAVLGAIAYFVVTHSAQFLSGF